MATKMNPEDLRRTIGRFRVLILGRANAGKTTILQKVCNTTERPEIYNAKGEKIDAVVVEGSRLRGNHDITNEMVFKSNPGFVFHDSCGFEAGSVEEFEEMKKFISERANATKLEERLHAIWYCIPMDDHWRTFQRSEEKFFSECNTGNGELATSVSLVVLGLHNNSSVPVIAVFTKFEALRPVAFGELEKQVIRLSKEECSERIAQRVEELFNNTRVWDRLCDPENRTHPKCYVRLQNMNEPDTNCNILVERTTFALDDEELRLCLVLTQQSNLELCIKCAVKTLVDCAHQQVLQLPTDHEAYQWDLAKWFPYLSVR
ncbi:uncharacterized protein EDB91DRAFT_133743 [Suillus paluster]|uniref:uncharacterized protein n=1 Tax=Suillus paluster TaxID=48578 RepID=UPI001B87882C|nr:uncharacterized protein EDB91DRAFT_133743 [Suillus paluster]KAG1745947.1 hypothetical protein EDB91DRAFT_133743 [Suillus paluster]